MAEKTKSGTGTVYGLAQAIGDLKSRDLPVLQFELRRRFRKVSPVRILQVATIVVLGLTVFGAATFGYDAWHNPVGFGRGLIEFWSFILRTGLILWVPLQASRAVVVEREAKTFEMLSLTSLSSASILMQKALGALLGAGILLAAVAPSMVLTFALLLQKQVAVEMVLMFGGLVLLTLLYCAIGLLMSCTCSSSTAAVFMSYLMVVIVLPVASTVVNRVLYQALIPAPYTGGIPLHYLTSRFMMPLVILAVTAIVSYVTLLRFERIRRP